MDAVEGMKGVIPLLYHLLVDDTSIIQAEVKQYILWVASSK